MSRPEEQARLEAKRLADVAARATKQRIDVAAVLLGSEHFNLSPKGGLVTADVETAREVVRNALRIADVLIEEANRASPECGSVQ